MYKGGIHPILTQDNARQGCKSELCSSKSVNLVIFCSKVYSNKIRILRRKGFTLTQQCLSNPVPCLFFPRPFLLLLPLFPFVRFAPPPPPFPPPPPAAKVEMRVSHKPFAASRKKGVQQEQKPRKRPTQKHPILLHPMEKKRKIVTWREISLLGPNKFGEKWLESILTYASAKAWDGGNISAVREGKLQISFFLLQIAPNLRLSSQQQGKCTALHMRPHFYHCLFSFV